MFPRRRRSRLGRTGQAMVIFALGFAVLLGFTGLALDAGHAYLLDRTTQNTADASALAAGKQLANDVNAGSPSAPPNPGSSAQPNAGIPVLYGAHDYAAQNGFNTTYSRSCEDYVGGAGGHLHETWFNAGFSTCNAASGFTTRIQVNVPPVLDSGEPPLPDCTGSPYNCLQVIVTYSVPNYILDVLGFSSEYARAKATVFATPPVNQIGSPPATAVYLYEPQAACGAPQCFSEGTAPSRAQMACTGTNNCPTFWTQVNTSITGYDGSQLSPPQDVPALVSNGDMVLGHDTKFCDPYEQYLCPGSSATSAGPGTNADGWTAPTGVKVYCSNGGGGSFPYSAPTTPSSCTTGTPYGGGHLQGSGGGFASCSPSSCSMTVTPGSVDCGALVLNGDTVANSFGEAGSIAPSGGSGGSNASCYPGTGDEYTIEPGKYQYIVINHGSYVFEGGIYDITGSAPVYTGTCAGSYAQPGGVDHCGESNNDFDLCAQATCANPSQVTAGVWIGQGKGAFWPAGAGGSSGACTSGGGGNGNGNGGAAGGGGPTNVTGTGVTFKLEPGAGGFVSTNEITNIQLSGPGTGDPKVGNLPVLIDEENSKFIHLDGNVLKPQQIPFSGIVFQTFTANAGGVELNPGLGHAATIAGQVLAYSLTTFGHDGTAVDFQDGYGVTIGGSITTSGKNETSDILVTRGYPPRTVDNGDGTLTLIMDYKDEWALDAYDTFFKINSGSPIIFSQNVWNCPGGCGSSQPPPNSTPSDANPAYHPIAATPGYTLGPVGGTSIQGQPYPQADDWIESLTVAGVAYKFEVIGDWMWGHEKDLSGSSMGNPDLAEMRLTFPKPATGTQYTAELTALDGDHCGDLVNATVTQPIAGGTPSGGTSTAGGVNLEE